jgi:hypothetical protein
VANLGRADYDAGQRRLVARVRRHAPGLVALVGLTVFRELVGERGPVVPGPRSEPIGGRPCWVLPNPSGRNAHFSYPEMLRAFVRLRIDAAARGLLGDEADRPRISSARPAPSAERPGSPGTPSGSR